MRTSSGSFMCSYASSSTRCDKRCGKQHGLAAVRRRQASQDEADVGDEAEIEHAIRLVQHQHLRMAHVENMLFEIVDQPAGRADQDVDAVLELATLLVVVHAAEDHGLFESSVATER